MNDDFEIDFPLSQLNAFRASNADYQRRWITTLSEFYGVDAGLKQIERFTKNKPPISFQMLGECAELDGEPPLPSEEWETFKNNWSASGEATFGVPDWSYASPDPTLTAPLPTAALPSRHRIQFPPFPIRDQGREGACVAYAVAAASEYCLGREKTESEIQALFDVSRKKDGYSVDGTTLSAALNIARRTGLLRNDCVLTPGAVEIWKETLVGTKFLKPSPIVASFRMFPSWLCSKAARLQGKWTLPFYGEPCVGLHAVLIVGYEDCAAPGGGFFIARNSWGEAYGRLRIPGHALVPFEYVQRFCVEAYAARYEQTDDFETKFVRVLEEDAREFKTRRLLTQGTMVVAHPNEPGVFLPYSSDTRAEFEANGYAWTRERRVLNYFPVIDGETKKDVEARLAASLRFANDLQTNLTTLVGVESPFLSGGFWSRVRRFRAVEEIADLSDAVRTKLARRNGLHNDLDCAKDAPDEWKSAVQASALVKIWRVDDGKKAFAVVGIWLAPLCFSPLLTPKFVAPTSETLNIALEVVDEWKSNSARDFEAICESFGTFGGSWVGLEGVVRRGAYVLSTFEPDERGGRWRAAPCETFVDERLRGLVRALNPTAFEDAVSYVRSVLERESRVFFGDFTVELVALKSGESQSAVEAALDELVKNGTYETYQTARGEKAYRKKR